MGLLPGAVSDTFVTLPSASATSTSPSSSSPLVTVTAVFWWAAPSYVHSSLAAVIVISTEAFVIVSTPFAVVTE